MRQQPITDHSFTEAEAMRIVRGLSSGTEAPSRRASTARARDVLACTVQNEVIPRLLAARRQASPTQPKPSEPQLAAHHVNELVGLLLRGTPAEATAYLGSLHASGVGTDSLLLDLLTPAARRLGRLWEDDLCDFTDVTIGVLRLHNMMRLVNSAFDAPELSADQDAPGILLVQAPGEQHGLGLAIVAHFFRGAGWRVRAEPMITDSDLAEIVRRHWFPLVGISVSCGDHLDRLGSGISALRRASCNPAIGVMVGGPPFIDHPQLVALVGADGTASDGRAAVEQARLLLGRQLNLLAREG
jgi:methanogenic corrinoid protein MtbC1